MVDVCLCFWPYPPPFLNPPFGFTKFKHCFFLWVGEGGGGVKGGLLPVMTLLFSGTCLLPVLHTSKQKKNGHSNIGECDRVNSASGDLPPPGWLTPGVALSPYWIWEASGWGAGGRPVLWI